MDTAESLARSLGGLAVVLGLIWIAVRLLRSRVGGPGQSQLRVVHRVAVGKKSAVALVRVADRCILVGVGDASITFLAEVAPEPAAIEGDALGAAPRPGSAVRSRLPTNPVPSQRSGATGLRGMLRRAQDRTVRR